MSDQVQRIAVSALTPHPQNPRIEARQEIVAQLAAAMADGFDASHALIVRAMGDGYQIISGHHRWLAAQAAGIDEVPCWVRDLSDDEAYMQLVLCNTQSELHALEEGKHAAESDLSIRAYADLANKPHTTLADKIKAWKVLNCTHVRTTEWLLDHWRNLAEIHAAPQWLWVALVRRMSADGWTVAETRKRVASVKDTPKPPLWADIDRIADAIVAGIMNASEITRMEQADKSAQIRDEDLNDEYDVALTDARPARLSEVQALVAQFEGKQAERDAQARAEEIAAQRALESAAQRIASLRANCSLDEWKGLAEDERSMLILPQEKAGGSLNKQESADIEWAQWSWNPVTGCKHDCPYCYARDIALSKRMAKVYPNGFSPTFRSNALNAPGATKVPKSAETDTRFRNVFTCSMADLFGRWVPAEWITAVLDTVRGNPQWNFLFLTKFPQRLCEFDIPNNAWMGTTVDLQARVANAEKAFAKVTSGVRWLSIEPMIEPLKFERLELFNWVVVGGASASSQTPEWKPPYRWIEALVRQCDDAGIPIYFKSNLGIANRVLGLPFEGQLKQDPQQAPREFSYLGGGSSNG